MHKPEHACTYPKYTVNELQTYPKQVLNTAKTTPRQTPKISSRTLSMPQTNLKCKRILDWQTLQKPYRNHMWIKPIEDAACTMRKALQHHGAARARGVKHHPQHPQQTHYADNIWKLNRTKPLQEHHYHHHDHHDLHRQTHQNPNETTPK